MDAYDGPAEKEYAQADSMGGEVTKCAERLSMIVADLNRQLAVLDDKLTPILRPTLAEAVDPDDAHKKEGLRTPLGKQLDNQIAILLDLSRALGRLDERIDL